MQRFFQTIAKLSVTAGFACWMITGTPAQACNPTPGKNSGPGISASMALLANLARLKPPAVEPAGRAGVPNATTEPAADPVPPTVVGLWHLTYVSGGQVVDESFETYFADGNEMEVDQTPPSAGNVCTGVWVQTGSLTYKLTHPAWTFDENGNVTGTVVIRDVITLDRNGYKYTGTNAIDVYDNNGALLQHLEGQLSAVRISPI